MAPSLGSPPGVSCVRVHVRICVSGFDAIFPVAPRNNSFSAHETRLADPPKESNVRQSLTMQTAPKRDHLLKPLSLWSTSCSTACRSLAGIQHTRLRTNHPRTTACMRTSRSLSARLFLTAVATGTTAIIAHEPVVIMWWCSWRRMRRRGGDADRAVGKAVVSGEQESDSC